MSPSASNVLIVDDSKLLRRIAASTLESAGYCMVDQAADADEALELLARRHYDVLVVDYYMPGMDGIGLIERVRSVPGNGSMSIVMLMSEKDSGVEIEAKEAGAEAFLCKPVHPAHLCSQIRELLAAKRSNGSDPGLRGARELLDSLEHPAIVLDRSHTIVLANSAFWDEVGSGIGEEPLTSCSAVHAAGRVPFECPLHDVEETGESCERIILDHGVRLMVAVSPLDAVDEQGRPLYLHVTRRLA